MTRRSGQSRKSEAEPWHQMWLNVRAYPRSNVALVIGFAVCLLLFVVPETRELGRILASVVAAAGMGLLAHRLNSPNVRIVPGLRAIVPAVVIGLVIFFGVALLFDLTGQFED